MADTYIAYYWKCPKCGFLWTICSDQKRYFPSVCINCQKHMIQWEEVEKCHHEEHHYPSDD